MTVETTDICLHLCWWGSTRPADVLSSTPIKVEAHAKNGPDLHLSRTDLEKKRSKKYSDSSRKRRPQPSAEEWAISELLQ